MRNLKAKFNYNPPNIVTVNYNWPLLLKLLFNSIIYLLNPSIKNF